MQSRILCEMFQYTRKDMNLKKKLVDSRVFDVVRWQRLPIESITRCTGKSRQTA